MAGSKGHTIGIFHLAPALNAPRTPLVTPFLWTLDLGLWTVSAALRTAHSLHRWKFQVCIDPADRRQQGIADLDEVKKPVCSGSEPISGLYHYAGSGEPHGQGAKEQETGDEVSMDDVPGNMIQPEQYPAHGSQGRSAVSGNDELIEMLPVALIRYCAGIDRPYFHLVAVSFLIRVTFYARLIEACLVQSWKLP